MFHVKHRKVGCMYTLGKILELENLGTDTYCVLFKGDSYIREGWLIDFWLIDFYLDLTMNIKSYMLEDNNGEQYLRLNLA